MKSQPSARRACLLLAIAGAAGVSRGGDFGVLVPGLGVDEVAFVVFVVMTHPSHGVLQAVLVASLGNQVEKIVGPNQDVESARIGRVGMIN
jgi:hypothetical protein